MTTTTTANNLQSRDNETVQASSENFFHTAAEHRKHRQAYTTAVAP